MKTLRMEHDRHVQGSGPYNTAGTIRRGVWTAIVILAVYLALGVFYMMAVVK